MKTIIASACALVVLSLGPTLAGDADKDIKALQGTWLGDEKAKELELKVSGSKWVLHSKEKDEEFSGTLTLDPKAKPPAIDMKVEGGKGKEAERFKGKTSLGIYELSGDTLRWCANEPGKENRPKEFSRKGEDKQRYLLIEFKRVK